MRFHHIGYLVKDIRVSVKAFERLGFTLKTDIEIDEIREAYIAFVGKDELTVELIQPQSEKSLLYNLFKHYKNSPYHICFSSDNIVKDVQELTTVGGYLVFKDYEIAPCLNNRKVVFLMHKDIGIIEILDRAEKDLS